MINNVEELRLHLLEKADLFEDIVFKKRFIMDKPGCSKERIIFLKNKISNIPRCYLHIINSHNINGIDVGGFNISPYGNGNKDTVEGLLEAYEDPFFPKEFMQKHKMYQIGFYNTDILCVTEGTEKFSEGEILYIDEGYDIYNPEDEQIHPLAKDFEQFLIIAGNLDELHTEKQGDDDLYDDMKVEFLKRLEELGVDKKYHQMWLSFL